MNRDELTNELGNKMGGAEEQIRRDERKKVAEEIKDNNKLLHQVTQSDDFSEGYRYAIEDVNFFLNKIISSCKVQSVT